MRTAFLFILTAAAYVLAQTGNESNTLSDQPSWGIRGGMTISEFAGRNASEFDESYGIMFGLFSEKQINPSVVFRSEINYIMKGAQVDWEESDSGVNWSYTEKQELKFSFNYIEADLIFKFLLPVSGEFSPNIFAGGFAGINTKATIDYDYYYHYYDTDIEFEETETVSGSEDFENISQIEMGIVLGGGVDIPLTNGRLLIDVRYDYGISSFVDDSDSNVYNRVVALTLGYGF
jgi:hypothetical protein